MRALSQRTGMFEFLKNMFAGKPASESADPPLQPALHQTTPQHAPAAPHSSATPFGPRRGDQRSGSGGGLQISLHSILSALPMELKGRVRQSDVGEATIPVPLEKALSQLASGAVKMTFGELRHAAPEVFSSGNDRDQLRVNLPLNEILVQINPALLVRRRNQKQVQVPEEIQSPFGEQGRGLSVSVRSRPSEPQPPARTINPEAPPIPGAAPVSPPPSTSAPATPEPSPAPPQHSIPFRLSPSSAPTPPPSPTKPPGPPPARSVPSSFPGVGAAPITPLAPSDPATPAVKPNATRSMPSQPAPKAVSLMLPLKELMGSWPETLRQEIGHLNLTETQVSLPVEAVREGLQRGKVALPWRVLRSWIKPVPVSAVSVHDGVMLDLPLKVLAPLFMAYLRDRAKPRHKVAIDENIPNLFSGSPQSSAPASPARPPEAPSSVSRPVDTNFYTWEDTEAAANPDAASTKAEPSGATTFITRCATPNEVVSRAAALDGVAGALIALPDGLMVASRISSDLNGDTLAAFLPHIFSKVSQCTKELRMGELNNLNFTVGNVPWKIFRVNAIFFAAFGLKGQPLPTAQLAALAAELDRKKQ